MTGEKKETSTIGTEFKIKVQMERIDGHSLSDLDFHVEVFTDRNKKRVVYEKEKCIMLDEDSYAIPVDSQELGSGRYFISITVYIPDTHFPEGVRKDVSTFYSGKEIMA